jgi:hypothetical protein
MFIIDHEMYTLFQKSTKICGYLIVIGENLGSLKRNEFIP